MYKLIAIDLDGTLLNSYGEISEENRKAIKYAIDKNIEVVLASGRDSDTMKKMSLDLGIRSFLVTGNGASIYNIKKQENIYESFLEQKKALKIIDICKNNSIFFNVYTDKGIITENINYNVKVFNSENNAKPIEKQTNIEVVENLYEYVKDNKLNILKIIICDESKVIFNRIIEKISKINRVDILEVEHMSKKIIRDGTNNINVEYFYTEISNKGTNKWEALKYLANYLNILEEEIMCIGDNENDRRMIENAGLGVSMKNSALASKNIGTYITEDNDSNGVALAIHKFL